MLSNLPSIKVDKIQPEKIISACVIFNYNGKKVHFPCYRHGNGCFLIEKLFWIKTDPDLDSENYGFLTSHNRFLNRKEGFKLASKNWQLKRLDDEWKPKKWDEDEPLLYSEDLW